MVLVFRGRSSIGRATRLQREGYGFKSLRLHKIADVRNLVKRLSSEGSDFGGSNPLVRIIAGPSEVSYL